MPENNPPTTLHDNKYGDIEIGRATLPNEPAFVLRGKDTLAALTVRLYAAAARNAAYQLPDSEQRDQLIDLALDADEAAARFANFAKANADRVRLPD